MTSDLSHQNSLSLLLKEMRRQIDIGLSAAVSVCAYRDGQLLFEEHGGTARQDSLFRVLSCAKPLAAAVLWRFRDMKRLNWDDSLSKYWPEFAKGRPEKQKVTIAHVLTHQSGLPSNPGVPEDEYGDWRKVVRFLEDAPLEYTAGELFEYHSLTFGWLVGELASRIGDAPFPDLFRKHVTEPLGLENTSFTVPSSQWSRVLPFQEHPSFEMAGLATTFDEVLKKEALMPGASGISTARDLARFYSALLNSARPPFRGWLSPEVVREVSARRFNIPTRENEITSRSLGMAFQPYTQGTYATPDEQNGYFGHGGAGSSVAWADPDSNLTVAILNTGLQESQLNQHRLYRLSDAAQKAALAC